MSTKIKFFKVNTLPSVTLPSSLYFIRDENTGLLSLYLTDINGSVSYRTHDNADIVSLIADYVQGLINQPNGIAGLDSEGNIINSLIAIIDGQDTLIKHNGEFIWKDLIGEFSIKNISGGNNPTWSTFFDNIQGLTFSSSTMNQVWVDFHIPHDYAMGTKVYPHIHFMPLTNNSGIVRWGIEYTVAKGHGQGTFPSTTTIYLLQTVPSNSRYKHFIIETDDTDAISSLNLEPDSFIRTRIFRDASHSQDTLNGTVNAWQCDIHYQAERIGTMNRKPNFFG